AHHQTARLYLRFRDPLSGQEFLQRVAAVRRVAQPERLLRGGTDAASAQIGPRLCALWPVQAILEEPGGEFHDIREARALLLPAFGLRVGRGHGNARHRGHPLHGFRKAQAIKLGQKAEVIARSPASEAVIAPLAVLAMKTRRLLPMEGTAGPV